jgi:hypothetical protein
VYSGTGLSKPRRYALARCDERMMDRRTILAMIDFRNRAMYMGDQDGYDGSVR